jgi:hypothetical protein
VQFNSFILQTIELFFTHNKIQVQCCAVNIYMTTSYILFQAQLYLFGIKCNETVCAAVCGRGAVCGSAAACSLAAVQQVNYSIFRVLAENDNSELLQTGCQLLLQTVLVFMRTAETLEGEKYRIYDWCSWKIVNAAA